MRLALAPRSLLGQAMLAMAAALVIAQTLAAVLLYQAAEQRREQELLHVAVLQLVSGGPRGDGMPGGHHHGDGDGDDDDDKGADRDRDRDRGVGGGHFVPFGGPLRMPPGFRYEVTASSPLRPGEARETRREAALRSILAEQGTAVAELVVTERALGNDARVAEWLARSERMRDHVGDIEPRLMVIGLRRAGEDTWQVSRVLQPRADPALLPGLIAQTVLLFAVLFGILYLVLRRIVRPLGALADSSRRFGQVAAAAAPAPVAPSGPDDIRRLIEAHNAMQGRILAMLEEKDVMLGAIGHDLKTPLAALRVRIEGVADPAARARMAATIDDIARTLDEILALARVGRGDAPAERTDLAALAASVVEEFEDMGAEAELAPGERIVAPIRLTWLKRALRNLVGNAVRYAGGAEVAVLRDGAEAVLRVADRGPGIAPERLEDMTRPFTRGEESRNRATGGAGLGLALTRAIAEQHGGRLVLANRPGGGLVAEIRLPPAPPVPPAS